MAHWLLPSGHLKVQDSPCPPNSHQHHRSGACPAHSCHDSPGVCQKHPLSPWTALQTHPEFQKAHTRDRARKNTGKGQWEREVWFWEQKEASRDEGRKSLLSHQVTTVSMKSKKQWLLSRTKNSSHTGYWPKKSSQNSLWKQPFQGFDALLFSRSYRKQRADVTLLTCPGLLKTPENKWYKLRTEFNVWAL